ncbi:MAG TPA: hypothetical protein VIP11_07520 [Gemmatimonadaceae bacterium]
MIRPVLARIAIALISASATACASSSAATSTDGVTSAGAPRRDRTQITAEEMRDVPAQNLYEIVQRLHPEWLVARNQGTTGSRSRNTSSDQAGVQVYMDTQRIGNVEMLRQLAVNSAASLKYYTASDAQSRFGNGNMNGAIQIISVATKR